TPVDGRRGRSSQTGRRVLSLSVGLYLLNPSEAINLRHHGRSSASQASVIRSINFSTESYCHRLRKPLIASVKGSRCLVPGFDGALFSPAWRDALWAKFFMAAPRRQRQSVERYSVVKRA